MNETYEIANKQLCLLLRNGIEIWLSEKEAENIQKILTTPNEQKWHFEIDGSIISKNEISGLFSPAHMEEYKRHKQGQWKCSKAKWHDRGEKCDCSQRRTIIRDGKKVEQEFTVGMGWLDR